MTESSKPAADAQRIVQRLEVAQKHAAFESRTRIEVVVIATAMLLTAVIPIVAEHEWIFLWQVPQTLVTWLVLLAQWLAALLVIVMVAATTGLTRAISIATAGAVLMAAAGAAAALADENVLAAQGAEQLTADVAGLPVWFKALACVGPAAACLLLWIEHLRLHAPAPLGLRVCEAAVGTAVFAAFGGLTWMLAAALAVAPAEIELEMVNQTVGLNPRMLLTCGIMVVGVMTLGGLAAVLNAVIPHRGRGQSIGVLTPVYFALIVLGGAMLLMIGKIFGTDGILWSLHAIILVLVRPLMAAVGIAAIAAHVSHRRQMQQLDAAE